MTGAVITSNITDNAPCPGEAVVYTCVSQGNTQRWRIENADHTMPIEHIYTWTDEPGTVSTKTPYIFTLVSTDYSRFESTIDLVVTVSMNNTVLECTGDTLRDRATIQIAGHYIRLISKDLAIKFCVWCFNFIILYRYTISSPEPTNHCEHVSQSLLNCNVKLGGT